MKRLPRSLLLLLALLALAGGWFLLAPPALPGGSTAYLVPSGTSMAPTFTEDDLVLVRESSDYKVGEIVAYRSTDLQQVVLHRIVRFDDGSYVLKGDNNSWIDSERPSESEIIGRLWMRVPLGGKVIAWLRVPRNAGLLGAGVGFLALGGFAGARTMRRKRRGRASGDRGVPSRTGSSPVARNTVLVALLVSIFLLLVSSAFAAYAFDRPLLRETPIDAGYTHEGRFDYSAAVSSPVVYDRPMAATGDPLFLKLSDAAQVRFEYEFHSDMPHTISGNAVLIAKLEDDFGWNRTFELGSGSPFTGDSVVAEASLDLASLGETIRKVESLTGVRRPGYLLRLGVHVDLAGTVAGESFEDEFSAEVPFRLDPLVLRVGAADDSAAEDTDPFQHSRQGSVRVTEVGANKIEVLGQELEVASARRISVAAASISLVAVVLLGLLILFRRPKDEPSKIQAKYGRRLIPVKAKHQLSGAAVEIDTMEALVRLADGYERMILHDESEGEHSYFVEGDVVVYRYRTNGSPQPEMHTAGGEADFSQRVSDLRSPSVESGQARSQGTPASS